MKSHSLYFDYRQIISTVIFASLTLNLFDLLSLRFHTFRPFNIKLNGIIDYLALSTFEDRFRDISSFTGERIAIFCKYLRNIYDFLFRYVNDVFSKHSKKNIDLFLFFFFKPRRHRLPNIISRRLGASKYCHINDTTFMFKISANHGPHLYRICVALGCHGNPNNGVQHSSDNSRIYPTLLQCWRRLRWRTEYGLIRSCHRRKWPKGKGEDHKMAEG